MSIAEYRSLLSERIGLVIGVIFIPLLVIALVALFRKDKNISFSAPVDLFVFCITFDFFSVISHNKLKEIVFDELSTIIIEIYLFFALLGIISLFWAVCVESGIQRKSNVNFIRQIFRKKNLDIPQKICDYLSDNYEGLKWKQFLCWSIFVILMSSSLFIIFF